MNYFNPLILPKVDILHTFNAVCNTPGIKWCSTFESTIPRTNQTVNRYWEKNGGVIRPDRITQKLLDLLSQNNCIGLLALSESAYRIQKNMVQILGMNPLMNKTRVLHPPQNVLVDDALLQKKFENLNSIPQIEFLFIGHNFFGKGGPQVVEALDRMKDKHRIHLTVISKLLPDSYASHTTDEDQRVWKEKLQNTTWITWHETLPNGKVLELARNAHVGLLPSLADTYGYSVLEMQACGLPVITSNVRALPEINNDRCGWVCRLPIDDIGGELKTIRQKIETERVKTQLTDQLESVFREIFERPDLIAEKGKKSLDRIRKNHDPVNYGKELLKVYRPYNFN